MTMFFLNMFLSLGTVGLLWRALTRNGVGLRERQFLCVIGLFLWPLVLGGLFLAWVMRSKKA